MPNIFDRYMAALRDYVVDGDVSTGAYEPTKAELKASLGLSAALTEGWVTRVADIPDGGEVDGERYVVSGSPAGVFVNNPNAIAIKIDGAWQFSTPTTGSQIYLKSAGQEIVYSEATSSWDPTTSTLPDLAAIAVSGSASDLTTGTVPSARLPNPTSGALGGIKTKASVSHEFLTSIGTNGAATSAQPSTTDLSDITPTGSALATASNASAARTTLGLGAAAVESLGSAIVDDGAGNLTVKAKGIVDGMLANGAAGIRASKYASLALADAAAVSANTYVDFSDMGPVTLTANFAPSAPWRKFGGNGIINRGAYTVAGDFWAPPGIQMFDAAGTGAITLTGNGDTVYLTWYGVTSLLADKGNNSIAMNSSLRDAQASGMWHVSPPFNIPLDAQSTIPPNSKVKWNGSTWDYSNASGAFANYSDVYCVGSHTALPALSANTAAGVTALTFVSAPSLVAGDVFFMTDTVLWNNNYVPGHNYYVNGEACEVASVSGSTVQLTAPIRLSYVAATTTLGKLNQNNSILDGMSVIGDNSGSNSAVILGHMGPSAKVTSPKVVGPKSVQAFYLTRCYCTVVTDLDISHVSATPVSSTYAGLVGNSQGVRIRGVKSVSTWHAWANGGDNAAYNILCYDNVVDGAHLEHQPSGSPGVPAADTHGNCENCGYINCNIIGGVEFGGSNNYVAGKSFVKAGYAYGLAGTAFSFSEARSTAHYVGPDVRYDVKGSVGAAKGYGNVFDADTPNGGLNSNMLGGVFRFYATGTYTHTTSAYNEYVVAVTSASAPSGIVEFDFSRSQFRLASNDAVSGGNFNITGPSAGTFIKNVALPKSGVSDLNFDLRYIENIDGRNGIYDANYLGSAPTGTNIYFIASGNVNFSNMEGRGGPGKFIYANQGTSHAPRINVKNVIGFGYSGKALDIDSGGYGDIGDCMFNNSGVTITHMARLNFTPGSYDGVTTLTGNTVLDYKAELPAVAVSSLPAVGGYVIGQRARVTDAAASPVPGSTATGGGSVNVGVTNNGTNWVY